MTARPATKPSATAKTKAVTPRPAPVVKKGAKSTKSAPKADASLSTAQPSPVKPAAKAPAPKKQTSAKRPAAAPLKTAKAAQATKPVQAPSTDALTLKSPDKAKKPKLVRDSFTMPKAEYAAIEAIKLRAGKLSTSAKKSEILRAGIKALSAMTDGALLAALAAVPTLKTGRPGTAKA